MSKRENIVKRFYEVAKDQRSVKFNTVVRDPIIAEELPRTGFPAAYLESSNEERLNITKTLRECNMDIAIVITVNGRDRDTQRNVAIEAIEESIYNDTEINSLVNSIELTNIDIVDVGEASPFATVRVTFGVTYCYTV